MNERRISRRPYYRDEPRPIEPYESGRSLFHTPPYERRPLFARDHSPPRPRVQLVYVVSFGKSGRMFTKGVFCSHTKAEAKASKLRDEHDKLGAEWQQRSDDSWECKDQLVEIRAWKVE